MNCYYHVKEESETSCNLCKRFLCNQCINPEDGYCWSCSHDFNAGLYQEKVDHKFAIKRIKEYVYCFLFYEFSYLLISLMFGRLSPIVFVVEAPFILIVGIPVSILIEWIIETKASKFDYKLKYIIGFAFYLFSALFCTISIFGIEDFELTSILTISVALSIFFILRILRSNRKRSIILVSSIGYLILIIVNFLTINSNNWI
ncbi:hypothetical protein [Cohnella luojiensis]|uniref:Uncharacterized protein n=1 Tax=Cohnella luojiensis TaxID=652876 RepID=A0A4Y8LNV2_9BACL|nr:hypothetical protein [Cohnella luojiensis]TFE19236.1 hypothetical protein E2980_23680 [Cohnella luojiensis]